MKALIQTATPKTAIGDIETGFKLFEKKGMAMPDPLMLYTASPGYFSIMLKRNIFFGTHPNLSPSLLAHIRYFVSTRLKFSFCRLFNKTLLERMGMTAQDFQAMGNDPENSLLEEPEKKMLAFVLRAMDDPEGITGKDLDQLRQHGWTDPDILDAMVQAVGMMDHNILMRVFKPSGRETE